MPFIAMVTFYDFISGFRNVSFDWTPLKDTVYLKDLVSLFETIYTLTTSAVNSLNTLNSYEMHCFSQRVLLSEV